MSTGEQVIVFGVLGPLFIRRGEALIGCSTPMLQRLLALLLCSPGSPVRPEAIEDALWDGDPPPSARKTLQIYAHRLRRTLDDGERLKHTPGGYALEVLPEELDSLRFAALVKQAQAAKDDGDLLASEELYAGALHLWRGDAFADVPDLEAVRSERHRLAEVRLNAMEAHAAIGLELGRHQLMTAQLAGLVAQNPYREGLRAPLMLALYRSGRQAEALEVYRSGARVLAEELGIEPTAHLQRIHQQILHSDPALELAQTAIQAEPAGYRFLPHAIPDFVGRENDLRWLDANARDGGSLVISAIAGAGGVGKTAIAVHWAHSAQELFPDGQFYVNLRGYDPGARVTPLDALGHLLRCLGLPSKDLPITLDDAAARYRALLAGKRALLLLDNASSVEQVRPLLPGTASCVTVVTSRDRLSGLIAREGARRLTLGALPPGESLELLRRLIGAQRLDAEPDAADSLVALCGGLPLALRIAGAQLADRPRQTVAGYLAEIESRGPIAALAVEGDESYAVRAILDQSYETLPAEAQRTFRLLATAPGPDLAAESIAALADRATPAALATLDELAACHLIEEPQPGRYSLHDLVHEYAYLLACRLPDEMARARQLLIGYRLRAAKLALSFMVGGSAPASGEKDDGPTPAISSPSEALSWLESEHANLTAAICVAIKDGHRQLVLEIGEPLWRYFNYAGRVSDWVVAFEKAHSVAVESDSDPGIRYDVLSGLGIAYSTGGRFDLGAAAHKACVQARHAAGEAIGEAKSRVNLAVTYEWQGRYPEALAEMEAALDSCRRNGVRATELLLLSTNMPSVLNKLGRHEQARNRMLEAVELARDIGTPFDNMRLKHHLGDTHVLLGEPAEGLVHVLEAVQLARQLGDTRWEANTTKLVGLAYRDLGDYASAVEHGRRAYEMLRDMGQRGFECEALTLLASSYFAAGDIEEAGRTFAQAHDLAVVIGSEHERARALVGLARIDARTDPAKAEDRLTEALKVLDAVSPAEAEETRHLLAALCGPGK